MRRTAVIGASAVAALGVGAVTAVTSGAQNPGGRTIELVTKDFKFKFVDNPPRARSESSPPSMGDQFLINARVFDKAGARLGSFDVTCSTTKGGRRGAAVCTGIWTLRDGELHGIARLGASDDVTGSIVGGTGAYVGARGSFESVDRPGQSGGDPSDDTITLLP